VIAAHDAAFGPPPMPVGWDRAIEITPVLTQFLDKGCPVPEDYQWQELPEGSLI
jgi:hypothetical protein